MNLSNSIKLLSLLLLFTLGMTSCDNDDEIVDPGPQNIAEIATSNDDFSILVEALTKANLVGAVSGTTELTVFAPTNAAFERLFTSLNVTDVDGLINLLGAEKVTQVLRYHVLVGEVTSSQVATGFVSTFGTRTAGGSDFLTMFIDAGNGVRINDKATVTTPDLDATNGVIHVIDEVILPLDIVDLAILSPVHTQLVNALGSADGNLVTELKKDGPFTVFAPTDAAFTDIASTVETLSMAQLATVLTYHVLNVGNVRSTEVPAGEIQALNGQTKTLDTSNGVQIIDQTGGVSTVQIADIQGTNGVIHVIDRVLIPVL